MRDADYILIEAFKEPLSSPNDDFYRAINLFCQDKSRRKTQTTTLFNLEKKLDAVFDKMEFINGN